MIRSLTWLFIRFNSSVFLKNVGDVVFILYEAEVELKNSVEVSIVKKPTVESRKPKTNIKLEQITPVKPEKKVEKVVEQKKPANPYIPEKSQPGATQPPPPETTPGKLTRFGEWKASHEK